MDTRDLQRALGSRPSREEAEEFLEKLAAPKLNPAVVGGALGAALLAGVTYASNAPGKDGKSYEQQSQADKELATRRLEDNPDFVPGVRRSSSKYTKDLADVFARHPGKAALLSTPFGASLGALIAKKLIKR